MNFLKFTDIKFSVLLFLLVTGTRYKARGLVMWCRMMADWEQSQIREVESGVHPQLHQERGNANFRSASRGWGIFGGRSRRRTDRWRRRFYRLFALVSLSNNSTSDYRLILWCSTTELFRHTWTPFSSFLYGLNIFSPLIVFILWSCIRYRHLAPDPHRSRTGSQLSIIRWHLKPTPNPNP